MAFSCCSIVGRYGARDIHRCFHRSFDVADVRLFLALSLSAVIDHARESLSICDLALEPSTLDEHEQMSHAYQPKLTMGIRNCFEFRLVHSMKSPVLKHSMMLISRKLPYRDSVPSRVNPL